VNQLDKSNINSFWPYAEFPPRISQTTVQEFIENLGPNIRYIIGEVPVGGGKSPLALNLSGWFSKSLGDAYILTPQKILQKQYEDSFAEHLLHTHYGKANYNCTNKGTNCEIGDSFKPRCTQCPYKQSLSQVAPSPNTVMNYSLALNLFKYLYGKEDSPVPHKGLLVFDEAHQLEGFLTEVNAITATEFKCTKLGIKMIEHKTVPKTLEWMTETYFPALQKYIEQLTVIVDEIQEQMKYDNKTKLTLDEIEKIRTLQELIKHGEDVEYSLLGKTPAEVNERYVIVADKTMIKFKELYGREVFKYLVEPVADRFLFLSSTILDKASFCSDLGIDPKKTAFISLDSEFPKENRPVAYLPAAKMTYGWDSPERYAERKKMLDQIVELAELHNDDNGVIHTGSFQIAKWLVDNLQGRIPHEIYHHLPDSGFSRDDAISGFQESGFEGVPKLLISPSVTEGLDLKDDKGRWAVFVKVPYPFLGDAWVKRRQSLSDRWYMLEALKAIIQGGGRVVRTPDDWGNVYILDSSWENLYRRGKDFLPKWWKIAYME
jgi:Rad3-related DNA helicase